MRLYLSLLAVLLLLCGANVAPQQRTVLAAVPLSRMDLPWWQARHEAKLDELRSNRVDLIFLGDSIGQEWEYHGPPEWRDFAPVWQQFYGDRNAINLGYTGDTTAHLLWRIEQRVAGITPKVAVIMIGANNLGRVHWSAQDTLAGIDAIIAQLHRRLPNTKLLLLGRLLRRFPLDHRNHARDQPRVGSEVWSQRRRDIPRRRSCVHAGQQV